MRTVEIGGLCLTRIMLLLLVTAFSSQAIGDERRFVFGVVPQQSAITLSRNWAGLLRRVSSESSVQLRFATAPTIPEFEKRLALGKYDFAYMNPYHYVRFSREAGYDAIARRAAPPIQGIIVVRRGSALTALADLAGTTLALPAPGAFAASMLPRAHLAQLHQSFDAKFLGSHDSVYRAVSMGLYPAGGGVHRTLLSAPEEVRSTLRVLWTTNKYTPHAFAIHPRVARKVRDNVTSSLLSLADTQEGRAALGQLKISHIVRATDPDWDDVRALSVELLDALSRE